MPLLLKRESRPESGLQTSVSNLRISEARNVDSSIGIQITEADSNEFYESLEGGD